MAVITEVQTGIGTKAPYGSNPGLSSIGQPHSIGHCQLIIVQAHNGNIGIAWFAG